MGPAFISGDPADSLFRHAGISQAWPCRATEAYRWRRTGCCPFLQWRIPPSSRPYGCIAGCQREDCRLRASHFPYSKTRMR